MSSSRVTEDELLYPPKFLTRTAEAEIVKLNLSVVMESGAVERCTDTVVTSPPQPCPPLDRCQPRGDLGTLGEQKREHVVRIRKRSCGQSGQFVTSNAHDRRSVTRRRLQLKTPPAFSRTNTSVSMAKKDNHGRCEQDGSKFFTDVKTTSQAFVGHDTTRHEQLDDAVARHLKRVHQWQKVHIAFFMGAFLCSLAGILAFGLVLKNFEVYCPLFANVSVRVDAEAGSNDSESPPGYIIDHVASVWGAKMTCDFCLFTTVTSFIYAFLWLWIFCSFSRRVEEMTVERLGSPWFRTVPPAVFVTCVFSMLVLSCAVLLTVGQASVCNSLERQIPAVRCGDAQDLPWKPGVIKMMNFHTLLSRAELATWLAAICWSLNSVLLCCRCVLRPEVFPTANLYVPARSDGPRMNRAVAPQS